MRYALFQPGHLIDVLSVVDILFLWTLTGSERQRFILGNLQLPILDEALRSEVFRISPEILVVV